MIQTLNPSHYCGQLSDPQSLGQSPIFRGKVAAGNDSATVHAYIKPIADCIPCPVTGDWVDNRTLAAEAIGHLLAQAVGLPVPASAGVILLETAQLPPTILNKLLAQPGAEPQADYLCWFSQDMAYPSLKQYAWDPSLPEPLRTWRLTELAGALLRHSDTPRIVAFDDWLANGDRNLGNLLAGPAGPLLIDHERIFVYPNWAPGELGSHPEPWRNKLFALLEMANHAQAHALPMKSARALACRNFAAALPAVGAPALAAGLARLFSPTEIADIMELVTRRLNPDTYANAIGLLA